MTCETGKRLFVGIKHEMGVSARDQVRKLASDRGSKRQTMTVWISSLASIGVEIAEQNMPSLASGTHIAHTSNSPAPPANRTHAFAHKRMAVPTSITSRESCATLGETTNRTYIETVHCRGFYGDAHSTARLLGGTQKPHRHTCRNKMLLQLLSSSSSRPPERRGASRGAS